MAVATPLAPPRDITIPEEGSTTARDVLSRSLGRLPRDFLALPPSLPDTDAGQAELAAMQETVRGFIAAPRTGAAALMSALRSPTISALLRSIRNASLKPALDRAEVSAEIAELVATLGFELCTANVLARELRLTRLPRRMLSLAARASIAVPKGATAAILANGRLRFELPAGHIEIDPTAIAAGETSVGVAITRPYHPIDGSTLFATDDNNPRAAWGAEPGEPGNPIDLGGRAPGDWTAMLKEGLDLLREHCPLLRDELELYIRLILPAGVHPETHRSASYRESVGAIYMTLHPRVMTMTEALIHEFSHNKLHALFEIDPVIENPNGARYRSPVRPDLRPLRGVLLALHAFLPIAYLYERMAAAKHPLSRQGYFPERFAQIRALNREGASVVFAHASPTPIGRAVLDEMRAWIAHFGAS